MADYLIRFVKANGIKIRLAVTGHGSPLLFLFGSGSAGTIDNAKPLLDRFSDQFSVACPDQRGLGESDVPPGPWSMADYAADAFGVADYLGWDRFSVIGLSFGGMVGLEMAATVPERIDRMVLWGTSPGGSAHSYPLHELDALPDGERQRRFAEVLDTRLVGAWDSMPEGRLVTAVLESGGSPWGSESGPRVPDWQRAGLALQLEARRGHDVVSRLGRISCPTFIGAGTYDGLAPVSNAELMRDGMPNAELRVYDAGHFFFLGAKAFSDGLGFLAGGVMPVKAGGRALSVEQAMDRLGPQ